MHKWGAAFDLKAFADSFVPPAAAPARPPWSLLPWLLLLGFVLRAVVALSGDFILHPNEIMQYLEPAHALVFGNGVLHWEFYYGARSWLVPGAIAGILFVCKVLGLGEPMYYIPAVRLTLCAFSLLIPLCLYSIGRQLFSEATGRVALVLGVFWYELAGFAHKPLQEFIAATLFLVVLALVLRPQRLSSLQAAAVNALAVFVVALRLQYGPLLAFACLLPFLRGDARVRIAMVLSAVAMVCAVGVFDMVTWGEFLQSYRTIYYYNAGWDAERISWGDTAVGDYMIWLSIASGGLVLVALAGAFGSRQRLLVLLLFLAVMLPHETQSDREYRFIFAVIPLWLLLLADVLCAGWRKAKALSVGRVAQRRRRVGLLFWAVLVSVAGIANALPWQAMVYLDDRSFCRQGHCIGAPWQEIPINLEERRDPITAKYDPYLARFLFGQDEVLALYRQLAADPSVRGIHDSLRIHAFGSGYYHLHQKVPLYDAATPPSPSAAKKLVSHLIATPFTETVRWRISNKRVFMLTKAGNSIKLPAYISDAARNKLTYWGIEKDSGEVFFAEVEGFVPIQAGAQYTLWKAEPPVPVHTWKSYHIYLKNSWDHDQLEKAMEVRKPPVTGRGFEFAGGFTPQ